MSNLVYAILFGLIRSLNPAFSKFFASKAQNFIFDAGIAYIITAFLFLKGYKPKRRDVFPLILFTITAFGSLMIYLLIPKVLAVELLIFEAITPIFISVFDPLITKGRPSKELYILMTITVPAYLLFYYNCQLETLQLSKYSALLFLAFLLFSLRFIGIKASLNSGNDPFNTNFLAFFPISIILLSYSLFSGLKVESYSIYDLIWSIWGIFVLSAMYFLNILVKRLDVLRATLIIYTIVPVLGLLMNFIILGEIPKINQILASVILFGGVFMRIVK